MTHTPEPPQHPASAYYPPPAYAAAQAKDLTAFGILAFSAAALATLFACVNATVVARAIREGATADEIETLDWSVVVYGLGSGLTVLALIAGWVTGSMWLFRARSNADLLEPGRGHARSSGWAWGGWICPIVSFWFPFQVVRDVHKALTPLSTWPVIGWWWGFYIVMTIGWRISGSVEDDATSATASSAQSVAIFFAIVMVVTLVLWGLVLRKVTKEQHDRLYGRAA